MGRSSSPLSNHPLVLATPFLGWAPATAGPGGVARASLCSYQLLTAFGERLSTSKAPADIPAARLVSPLTLGLTGPAWARRAIAGLILTNPLNLQITALDWEPGEDTTFVAPVLAVAGAPAVPGLPARPHGPCEFLTLVSVVDLEDRTNTPWSSLSYLAGLLGPCLTQAERNRRASQVQLSARALAAGCQQKYRTVAGDDYSLLAGNLYSYLRLISPALPGSLRGAGVGGGELRLEGRDAMQYARDSEGRRMVEENRIHLFSRSESPEGAVGAAGPQGAAWSSTTPPLWVVYPLLSAKRLFGQTCDPDGYSMLDISAMAVLAASASEAGATQPYVVSELVRQTQALRSAGLPAGAVVAAGAGVAGAPAVAGAGEALEAALSGAAFVRFRQVMLSTDLLTAAGRRKVFEAATEGDCILPIRLLLSGEAGLAKKDSALGALMLGLRPFLSEWFSRVAVLDVIGACGRKTSFLDSFLKLDFHAMNWLGSHDLPGLYHFLSAKNNSLLASPHPADHFCVPLTVRALAEFGQSLFSGLGYPAQPRPGPGASAAGYSWKTWWEFIATVLEHAAHLGSREAQLNWLDEVHEQAEAALLLLMSRVVRAEIFASEGIRDHTLDFILPY
ncbi:MAG: hypothetical protein SGPRY_005786 [Prymnesium sp.]